MIFKELISMLTVENYLGTINISYDYLVSLISYTASGCFGVAAMNTPKKSGILSLFRKSRKENNSVSLRLNDGKLIIGIHISVLFGTNISAVVNSLVHKIRYTVEEKTGIKISKITVYVDDMIS
jgi:uncharacterized alkaline shock family protein YloU